MTESTLNAIQAATSIISSVMTFIAIATSLYIASNRFKSRIKADVTLGYPFSTVDEHGHIHNAILSISNKNIHNIEKYKEYTPFFHINIFNTGDVPCTISSIVIESKKTKEWILIHPAIHHSANYNEGQIHQGDHKIIVFPIHILTTQENFLSFWNKDNGSAYYVRIFTGNGSSHKIKMHKLLCAKICEAIPN